MFTTKIDDDLKLALVEPSFAPRYWEIVSNQKEYLSQWLTWPPYAQSEDFFLAYIEKSLTEYAENRAMICGILYKGELVGNISFNTINKTLKKVEIGYWLDQNYQGKGIMTRSLEKMVDIAFTDLNMEKIQISVAVENSASRKVCENLKMNLEGTITNCENLHGRIIDHAIYGLKRSSSL